MRLRDIFICIVVTIVLNKQCIAGEMSVKKIVLGNFKYTSQKTMIPHSDEVEKSIISPKFAPIWPKINRHNLTMDDNGLIYLFNIWNNEILIYDSGGKLVNKISLPSKFQRAAYGNRHLEVSGDGKLLFVDDGMGNNFICGQHGQILKQFTKEVIGVDFRLCNNTYVNLLGNIYNSEFRKIGVFKERFPDPTRGFEYSYLDNKLAKYTKDGKKVWEKEFWGYNRFLGVDNGGNLYMYQATIKQYVIDKLNSAGEIIAQAAIANPFPFLTQEEDEEWEIRPSEESIAFPKLTCNGNVYMIFQHQTLPSVTFTRWLKGGEYFLYKFEMKK